MAVIKVFLSLRSMKKFVFTILACLVSIISFAQSDFDYGYDGMNPEEEGMAQDSTEREIAPFYRVAWKWKHDGVFKEFVPIDTVMDGIHNTNLIFKKSVANTYLGNFPSPYLPAIYVLWPETSDFMPLDRIRAYIFRPEDALAYNMTAPYTQLSYFNGGGKGKSENWLDVWHLQNISPFWNAGIRYNLMSSDGAYQYQKTKIYNFAFFSDFEKERVAVSFFLNQNVGRVNENGGVEDVELFRDTTIDAKIVATRLQNEPNNNFYNFNLYASGQYNIGKGKEVIKTLDSLRSDTLITYPMKATLTLRIEDDQYKFREEGVETTFFPVSYLSEGNNADKIKARIYEVNTKFILNEHPKYKYLPGVYAGLTFKYLKHGNRISADTINNWGETKATATYLNVGAFNVDSTAMFTFDVWGDLCLLGDYSGDYKLAGEITHYFNRNRNAFVKVNALVQNTTPTRFYEYYFGNHQKWDNDFDKVHSYQVKGEYRNVKLRTELGVALNNTKNYLYFGEDALPAQYSGDLLVFTAWAKECFRAGHFYFDETVYYQLSNKTEVLDLPMVALYSHNYYMNRFFKNALGFQLGVDLFYNTSFYAPAYMPSIMQFYNQREEKLGNYPKLDLFLVLNIKRADIFAKLEHFNMYFGDRNYFSAYTYPINPMKFKFGVRWNFYD